MSNPDSAVYLYSHGIGLAIGLFVMQEFASLFQNQYMQLGMSVGMLSKPLAPMVPSYPA